MLSSRVDRIKSFTCLAAVTLALTSPAAAEGLKRLGGTAPNGRSLNPHTNADGTLVVFQSAASNLVSGDLNELVDVFLTDTLTLATDRVSISATGRDPNDSSFPPSISADGGTIAYGSAASNIVQGDFNTRPDVFVFDRGLSVTSELSLSQDGFGGGAVPDLPSALSQDGRFVAYVSEADRLDLSDVNHVSDIFVYDQTTQQTEVLTLTSLGSPTIGTADGPSGGPSISADGCIVAFYSDAGNLVPADTNERRDVFVRNRCSGEIQRVSVATDGSQANASSSAGINAPAVSADGNVVAFLSNATNLDAADDDSGTDVYVHRRDTGETFLLSKNQSGERGNGVSGAVSISADGRFVVFESQANNLIAGDGNGHVDVFVVDLNDGEVRRVSVDAGGQEVTADSNNPQISGDGLRVVFQAAGRLIPDDQDNQVDVYITDNPLGTKPLLMSPTPTPTPTETPTPEDATVTPTPSQTSRPTSTPTGQTSPSPTQTPPAPTHTSAATFTPTIMPSFTALPTRTRTGTTVPTPVATAVSHSGGGGGGCGCVVDPVTGAATGQSAWSALLLPAALLLLRRRSRGLE